MQYTGNTVIQEFYCFLGFHKQPLKWDESAANIMFRGNCPKCNKRLIYEKTKKGFRKCWI